MGSPTQTLENLRRRNILLTMMDVISGKADLKKLFRTDEDHHDNFL